MSEISSFKTHYNPSTNEYQANWDHLLGTAEIARKRNKLPELDSIVYLTALLHDLGKYSEQWQKYFQKSVKDERTGKKLDHATAGGQLARELMGSSAASVMIQTAIYSHHGLYDCYSSDDVFCWKNEKAP